MSASSTFRLLGPFLSVAHRSTGDIFTSPESRLWFSSWRCWPSMLLCGTSWDCSIFDLMYQAINLHSFREAENAGLVFRAENALPLTFFLRDDGPEKLPFRVFVPFPPPAPPTPPPPPPPPPLFATCGIRRICSFMLTAIWIGSMFSNISCQSW